MINTETEEDNYTTQTEDQSEILAQSLARRPNASSQNNTSTLVLELGYIIQIISPTNEDYHEKVYFINYIDKFKMKLLNIDTNDETQLGITPENHIDDDSITEILILNKPEEKGFARQNNLGVHTWVDIYFGGDVPAIITGEITNVEEDMIEVLTYPGMKHIYIDFEYKGIPENLPLENIIIREKPSSLKSVVSLASLKNKQKSDSNDEKSNKIYNNEVSENENIYNNEVSVDGTPLGDGTLLEKVSVEYNDQGESTISVPENVIFDENIDDILQNLYANADTLYFEEDIGTYTYMVEVPEGQQRFAIETQIADFVDTVLSTIPLNQRTKAVMNNIHTLVERYKHLRNSYSTFDQNANIKDFKYVGHLHKPLVDHIKNLDTPLSWLIPVVKTHKKIITISDSVEPLDYVSFENFGPKAMEFAALQKKTNGSTYAINENRFHDWLQPFEKHTEKHDYMIDAEVKTSMDTVINNLTDYTTYVFNEVVNANNAFAEAPMDIDPRTGFQIMKPLFTSKFVSQRYNTGEIIYKPKLLKNSKSIYVEHPLTLNEKMQVASLLMLPETMVRFSFIRLPSANISIKSSLHQNYISPFKFLHKKTEVNEYPLKNINRKINYEDKGEIAFLKNITNFSYIQKYNLEGSREENYDKFLNAIIPNTYFLIEHISKYIKDKISFVDIVKELEPFYVYANDITYNHYLKIRYTIIQQIKRLKTNLMAKQNEFMIYKNAKYNVSYYTNTILRLLDENPIYITNFYSIYKIRGNQTDKLGNVLYMSPAELIVAIMNTDDGVLFTNMVSSMLISLVTPKQLMDVLNKPNVDDMTDNEKIKPADCSMRYLAKRYNSIGELQKDNNTDELFYDEEFDDTPYNILKRYEKEQKTMSPPIFLEYLADNLVAKHDCPKKDAAKMASTMVLKKKRVGEGEYAIVVIKPTLPENMKHAALSDDERAQIESEADVRQKIEYYKRSKNYWVKDDEIEPENFIDNNTLFCNISKNCFKNTKNNVCEPATNATARFKEIAKKNLLDEFDKRYTINVDELRKELESNIASSLKTLLRTRTLREIQANRANNIAYDIGQYANKTANVASPYLALRDLILGQDDFVKKQHDICRFIDSDTFSREPMVDELKEDRYWLYCKETNTKLFPRSLYILARAFVYTRNKYTEVLEDLCHHYGKVEGDAIVDEHSGYVLRKIDYATDEGFDEQGFKVTTHSILEDYGDIIQKSLAKKEHPVFDNPIFQTIYNILLTMCENADIDIDLVYNQVLLMATELEGSTIMKEAAYMKRSAKQEKEKGKALPPYEKYKNETLIFMVTGILHVVIQTAIPPIRTTKTFPGCIRSFGGYPLGGVEDKSGLTYLSCILFKTKQSTAPYDSIKKYRKVEDIVSAIQMYIEKYVLTRGDITEAYNRKREFLMLTPDFAVVEEHNVAKWLHFLPPIIAFSVYKTLKANGDDFDDELLKSIRQKHKNQFDLVAVLKGKTAKYGYGIIELINTVVKSETLVLKTSQNIPFLENACCNDTDYTNPLEYFIKSRGTTGDANLKYFISIIAKMATQLTYVKQWSKAPMLYHPASTQLVRPAVPPGQLPENIYGAVIEYCNLDKDLPIPIEYNSIIAERPEGYNRNMSILEKMELFKSNGKRFDTETLHSLMRIVNTRNIVDVEMKEAVLQVGVFAEVIDGLEQTNSAIFTEPLRIKIMNVVNNYKPEIMYHEASEELVKLQKYLNKTNRDLMAEITQFLDEFGNLSNSEYNKIGELLADITEWSLKRNPDVYYDDELFNTTRFIENMIMAFSKIYPHLIINKARHITVPDHWDLSDQHKMDIDEFIKQYYSKLVELQNDPIIVDLLERVVTNLTDITVFIKNIPIFTEIIKPDPENNNNNITYYSLFDKETVFSLYKYCLYSCIYEYIILADNKELIKINKDAVKKSKQLRLTDSDVVFTAQPDFDEEDEDDDMDLQEIQIRTGNIADLKERVCSLLVAYFNIERDNKKTLNYSYAEIIKRVNRSKDKEKRRIIKAFQAMDIDERKVENELKNHRMGRWNVGQQKGLVKYDKRTYDRERTEFFRNALDDVATNEDDQDTDIYNLPTRRTNTDADANANTDVVVDADADDIFGEVESESGYDEGDGDGDDNGGEDDENGGY